MPCGAFRTGDEMSLCGLNEDVAIAGIDRAINGRAPDQPAETERDGGDDADHEPMMP